MIDFHVAFDKLASMESADEIAGYFRYEGIKGIPKQHDSCAIAVWMSQQTGGKISVSDIVRELKVPSNQAITTKPMLAFIRKFDSLDYPELIKGDLKQ